MNLNTQNQIQSGRALAVSCVTPFARRFIGRGAAFEKVKFMIQAQAQEYPHYPDWPRETHHAKRVVRLAGVGEGVWVPFKCSVYEATGHSAILLVPELRGTWAIHKTGMVGNIGGNDWRIYTLFPEDCAALCALPEGGAS